MPFTYDQKRQQYTSELDPEALEIVRMLTPPIAIDDIPQPLEFNLSYRVENDVGKAVHLHAHCFEIEVGADRVLHPAVGDQNPQRGEV